MKINYDLINYDLLSKLMRSDAFNSNKIKPAKNYLYKYFMHMWPKIVTRWKLLHFVRKKYLSIFIYQTVSITW